MKQVFFIAVMLMCFIIRSTAQPTPPELQRKIAGKKNLKAIMYEVEKFYKAEEKERQKRLLENDSANEDEFESELLHWKRWEYFNKTRLKPNGDLEDITAKTITAWQKVTAKYGDGRKPTGTNIVTSGTNAAWSFIGPFNLQYQGGLYRGLCRIDKIVFHPTNSSIIYAGANNGGLWRTLDGGNTWASMNFYFPIQSASGIVINPNNFQNIFVLTGDGNQGGIVQNSCGIWVTYDGGSNWIKTSFNSNAQTNIYNGFKLVMMPGNSNILFACTRNGLYRSGDGGINWTGVLTGGVVYDIEFDPSLSSRIYASSVGTFYRSDDSGLTFPAQTNIPGATRIEIAVSPANNNYVYLLCGPYGGGTGTNTFGGVYRSSLKGSANSFTLRANSPNVLCSASNGIVTANDGDQSGYDLAIDVNKINAEVITVAGKIVWQSTNGGSTFINLTPFNEGNSNPTPPANYIHPDVHDIAYNPLNGWLYAGTDGGIYRSTDNGVNWTNITNGIHATTFYHMAGALFDANRILGGTQDNGVKYKSDVGDFTHITGADGFDCAFGPSAASSIYTTVNASIQKFDINGATQAISTPANTSFFPVIATDPVTNNIVYLAAGAAGVLKSTDGGQNWSTVLNQPIQQSICTCPDNANRVYVTGTASIFRSDNGGNIGTWSSNLAANPGFINSGQITDINVSSGNSNFVWVTMGGYTAGRKVFYSNDAGANWFNLSGTLPAEVKVNCVAVDQGNNAYIGTDIGVYYQAVYSFDWTPFFNDLPRVPVTDLSIHQGSSKIRAATYGHGIWETGLFTTCDLNFNLTGTIVGDKFFQASNQISSDATIVGGTNTKVIVRAGNKIILNPGFRVFLNNTFKGIIGACESGPVPTIIGRSADIPPVFMSQVNKGNDTTLYPYGTIIVNRLRKGSATVSINAIKVGDFSVIVTDKNGINEFVHINENIQQTGTIIKPLAISGLAKGKYYVQLYYNSSLVHVQELDVK